MLSCGNPYLHFDSNTQRAQALACVRTSCSLSIVLALASREEICEGCPLLNITYWASVCCLLVFLTVSPARADNLYGTIRGTVSDQTGAVIPGATVTIRNQGTGISRTAQSLADGGFEFVNLLAPATYAVSVEKEGFRRFVSENVHLEVNQVFVANATLEVGAGLQQVTVEAQTAQINTTGMQLGTTITGNTIVDLPLNGRNWIQLQQLQPGVVGASDRFGVGTMGTNFSTNGSQTQQNSFYVNGTDTADISLNAAGVIPSPDAIGEFHMVTSTINPEFGRNSGAIFKRRNQKWHQQPPRRWV